MWMFPVALACGNTFILKPSERDPSAGFRIAELLLEAGLPRACSTSSTATRRRSTRSCSIPGSRRSASSARPPIAEYIYATAARRRQARAGAGRRQEPHGRDARRRSRPGGRRADGRGLRLGRRALHGDLGGGRGRRRRRQADGQAGAAGARAEDRARHRPRGRDGAARHRAASATRCAPMSISASQEGAKLVVDGRGLKLQGYENGFFIGGCAVRRRHARDAHLQGGDLRPGAVGRARAGLRRARSSWSTTTNTATASRSSPATATPRASSPTASRSAWSASTCRSRCRWRSTASAAGSARCSATWHMHGTGGRALLHAAEDHHRALADRHPRRRRIRHADDAVTGAATVQRRRREGAGAWDRSSISTGFARPRSVAEAERRAAENRVAFGRSKAERRKAQDESERASRDLENKRLD